MKVRLFIATVVAVFLAAGATTVQAHLIPAPKPFKDLTLQQQAQYYERNAKHAIAFLRPWNDIRSWQMLSHRHWIDGNVPEPSEVVFHRNLLRNSIRGLKQVEAKLVFVLIPHYSSWLCIHSHEGSWTDSGDPYWGGLQMDRSFMMTYGSDMVRKYGGWANLWSPTDQMIVAERAYNAGRGFGPWPNTARMCGLL